ncbi:MAG: folate-binding protein [Pseudomonadota bacterium]
MNADTATPSDTAPSEGTPPDTAPSTIAPSTIAPAAVGVGSGDIVVAPHRRVIAIQGSAARDVLQDVVTNNVQRLGPKQAVYAALLTPQGKYLFDFFLLDPPSAPGVGALIDVAADRAEALSKRLSMYCIRRDAKVTGDAGLGVALALASAPPPAVEGLLAVADPRHAGLGYRLYAPDIGAALAAAGWAASDPAAAAAAYEARRIALGVPETGAELVVDDSYILEAGFDRLNGVDFRKGCYVGQEVTARMRHRTELRKRLVRVAVEGEAPPGSAVRTAEGKPAGTLFSAAGGLGLAHLRLERATGPLQAEGATLRMLPDDPEDAEPG